MIILVLYRRVEIIEMICSFFLHITYRQINLVTSHLHKNIFFSGVPFPPAQRLTIPEVFDQRTNKPKPDILKQHFILEGRIDESAALKIINEGAALLRSEKTMVDIEAPVTGNVQSEFVNVLYLNLNHTF